MARRCRIVPRLQSLPIRAAISATEIKRHQLVPGDRVWIPKDPWNTIRRKHGARWLRVWVTSWKIVGTPVGST